MRLFIGIAPDRAAREALAQTARLLWPHAPGRYVDPSLYHLTLAFLGEMDSAALPSVQGAMAKAAQAGQPFAAPLEGIGAFGPVLFCGVRDDGRLRELSDRLCAALAAENIAFDRKTFRPHITLARDAARPPRALVPVPARLWVREVTLFESTRAQGCLAYIPRASMPLGAHNPHAKEATAHARP